MFAELVVVYRCIVDCLFWIGVSLLVVLLARWCLFCWPTFSVRVFRFLASLVWPIAGAVFWPILGAVFCRPLVQLLADNWVCFATTPYYQDDGDDDDDG